VLLVVGYHLVPDAIPAGFVGVDVFFVLSGFLITGLLLGPADAPRPRLGTFLARRARRLLPAAGLVVAATIVAGLLVLPATRRGALALESIASSLQVENWLLAFTRAEYSAAEVAGPLQHFWSLSIEWQTYLVWMGLFAIAAATGRHRRHVALAGAIAITALSLALTLASGALDTDLRYFATPLRLWEFGAGALLAFLPTRSRSRPARETLAAVGLAAVVAAAFLLGVDGHPGVFALLPVLGAVALLEAGRHGELGLGGRVLAAAPLRVVGDHSYAVYLWHWPVLVLVLAMTGAPALAAVDVVVVLALTAVLAYVTTRWVENPVRRLPLRRAMVVAATATLVPVLIATPVLIGLSALRAAAPDPDHPGALAIDPVVAAQLPDVPFIPDVTVARDDHGYAGADLRCVTPGATPVVCQFGDPDAARVLVVVGDSHAWQWVATLDVLGVRHGWRVESLVRPSCPLAPTTVDIPGVGDDGECAAWRENALQLLEEQRPDLVLTTGLTPAGYETIDYHVADAATFASGYVDVWRRLAAAGIDVGAIRDTPYFPVDVPECVAASLDAPEVCDQSRLEVLDAVDDPLLAATAASGVGLVDLTDWICLPTTCPVVVGNVLVYRDRHHLTATYAQTLEPAMTARLRELGLLG
jgi:peptidoglycan/LPS O-acetylase OafA/YrhL